jgi:hypothetical protein
MNSYEFFTPRTKGGSAITGVLVARHIIQNRLYDILPYQFPGTFATVEIQSTENGNTL